MGNLGLDPIWLYMQHSKHLQKLQLFEANVTDSSEVCLALKSTTSLQLNYCIFVDLSVERFAMALANNQPLHTLPMPAGELSDSQLACILSNLHLSKLKVLKLPRNYLEQSVTATLGSLLDPHSACQLASLDLSHQHTELQSSWTVAFFSAAEPEPKPDITESFVLQTQQL